MSALGKIAAILGVKPKKDGYDPKQYDTSGLKPVGVPEDNIGAPPPMAVKPQVQTIGGLQVDGKPETSQDNQSRPRVVPNAPITQNVPEYQRDAGGLPQMPDYANPNDNLVRSDGTQSPWTWGQVNALRNYSGRTTSGGVRPVDDPTSELYLPDGPARPMLSGDFSGAPGFGQRYADQQAQNDANSAPMAVRPQSEVDRQVSTITNKNYQPGVYRNPQTGETTNNPKKPGFTEVVQQPGADRDKKWSLKDKIGSTLL
jgi:hypothetical protein